MPVGPENLNQTGWSGDPFDGEDRVRRMTFLLAKSAELEFERSQTGPASEVDTTAPTQLFTKTPASATAQAESLLRAMEPAANRKKVASPSTKRVTVGHRKRRPLRAVKTSTRRVTEPDQLAHRYNSLFDQPLLPTRRTVVGPEGKKTVNTLIEDEKPTLAAVEPEVPDRELLDLIADRASHLACQEYIPRSEFSGAFDASALVAIGVLFEELARDAVLRCLRKVEPKPAPTSDMA